MGLQGYVIRLHCILKGVHVVVHCLHMSHPINSYSIHKWRDKH